MDEGAKMLHLVVRKMAAVLCRSWEGSFQCKKKGSLLDCVGRDQL